MKGHVRVRLDLDSSLIQALGMSSSDWIKEREGEEEERSVRKE